MFWHVGVCVYVCVCLSMFVLTKDSIKLSNYNVLFDQKIDGTLLCLLQTISAQEKSNCNNERKKNANKGKKKTTKKTQKSRYF